MNKVETNAAVRLLQTAPGPYVDTVKPPPGTAPAKRYPYRQEPYGRARLLLKDGGFEVRDVKVQFRTLDNAFVMIGFVDDEFEVRSFWVPGLEVKPITREESSYKDPYDLI